MARREEVDFISFEIVKKYAPAFEAVLLKWGLTDQAKDFMRNFSHYGGEYSDLVIDPSWDDSRLLELEEAATGYRGMKGAIHDFRVLKQNPLTSSVKNMEGVREAVFLYLETDAIDGWIYTRNETDKTLEAYLVTSVIYVKEVKTREDRQPPYVVIRGCSNVANCGDHYSYSGVEERSWTIQIEDLGKSIPKVFYDKGILKETPEFKAEYTVQQDRFEKFQPMNAEQFLATGKVWQVKRDRWSSRQDNGYDLGSEAVRVVNDEAMLQRRIKSNHPAKFWRDRGIEEGFNKIPTQPYVFCFDLDRHCNCWIHVMNMEVYIYDEKLRDKIILPQEHRDLIEILTTDLDVFAEVGDVIKGKSGGTSILCIGKPGLGKTLTAEVYGEVRKRPLYKVHSGQLGTTGQQVESALEICLKRAERWNAVMLIDEADVFIRQRGDDVEHNAIVAAFLRTLEYFHGLLFMTTNREDDVDDAILSRMIAVFKYAYPVKDDAIKIWRVMRDEFKITLADDVIEELATKMPDLSGRDIKQMLKLTSKYAAKKGIPLSYDCFRICSMFRGRI